MARQFGTCLRGLWPHRPRGRHRGPCGRKLAKLYQHRSLLPGPNCRGSRFAPRPPRPSHSRGGLQVVAALLVSGCTNTRSRLLKIIPRRTLGSCLGPYRACETSLRQGTLQATLQLMRPLLSPQCRQLHCQRRSRRTMTRPNNHSSRHLTQRLLLSLFERLHLREMSSFDASRTLQGCCSI